MKLPTTGPPFVAAALVALLLGSDLETRGQDLFPTPEGRLGGREPLPTPGTLLVTPIPPTPAPTVTATPTASVEATPTRPSGAATAVAIEPGAFEAARSSTVTVIAASDGSTLVGSGWVYDGDGTVVTAAPLVEGAERFEVVAADGRRLTATLLGLDNASGVAVLATEMSARPPLPVGGELAPGQAVVAVGTAGGIIPGTIVGGFLSSSRAELPDHYPGQSLIVASLAAPSGMAGGPLLDGNSGAVVGLVVPDPILAIEGAADPAVAESAPDGARAIPAGEPGLTVAVPIAEVGRIVAGLAAGA